jgi:hypothetical protein
VGKRRQVASGVAVAATPSPAELAQLKAERRAAREAKRAKQRAENVGRAKAMHAARLADTEPSAGRDALASAAPVHIGCSGWFYWHWGRCFYPPELTTRDWPERNARKRAWFSPDEAKSVVENAALARLIDEAVRRSKRRLPRTSAQARHALLLAATSTLQ